MVKQSVWRVAHGTDHGELVIHLSQFGQVLSELNTGQFGVDVLENGLHVVWHVFFGVPQVKVGRATLQVAHDDALGFAPSRAAGDIILVVVVVGGRGLQLNQVGKGQPQHARRSNTQNVPSCTAKRRIANVFSGCTLNVQH